MNKLLEETIAALNELPENKQEAIAFLIKEKIASEKPWNEVIELTHPSIDKLGEIITGNSNLSIYKTQKQIEGFFDNLECNKTKQDSESRRDYTERLIRELNGTFQMEKLINSAFHRDYFKTPLELKEAIKYFNETLRGYGYEMIPDGECYKIGKLDNQENNHSKIKQLIFAQEDGKFKPKIEFNPMTNEIEIVENGEYSLVYDSPIKNGLLWEELEDWWKSKPESENKQLQERLKESLSKQSSPEQYFWDTYFNKFKSKLGDKFPALIPQVYFHYNFYTEKELEKLGKVKSLPHQRMDFLLLLPGGAQIVVEIDGKQHYAEGDKPSPKLYAKMVAEDRKLKFNGYEVYRFGGSELHETNSEREEIVTTFFDNLFKKYKIIQD